MPTETRLLGYGIGSRGTRQAVVDPDGNVVIDAQTGQPQMMDVTELIMVDQVTRDAYILPLTPQGVQVLMQALQPSPIVVPQPGLRL